MKPYSSGGDFCEYECIVCRNCVEVTQSGMAIKGRELQIYCFYCVSDAFKTGARKIGHKADWTGRVPKWCPVKVDRRNLECQK